MADTMNTPEFRAEYAVFAVRKAIDDLIEIWRSDPQSAQDNAGYITAEMIRLQNLQYHICKGQEAAE